MVSNVRRTERKGVGEYWWVTGVLSVGSCIGDFETLGDAIRIGGIVVSGQKAFDVSSA